MPFRRFNVFSSRVNVSSNREESRNAQHNRHVPSSSGFQRPEEAPTPLEIPQQDYVHGRNLGPVFEDVIDIHASVHASAESRSPTYYSHQTSAPSYTTQPRNTILDDNEQYTRIDDWSAGVFHATSLPFLDSSTPQVQAHESQPELSQQDAASNSGTSASSSGPRYIYYRVYTQHGAIISKYASEGTDPSLGRIFGRSVAPPHTAALLKKRLCDVEGIVDDSHTEIFLSCAAESPTNDKTRLSLLSSTGPGSLLQEPIALIVNNDESEAFREFPEFAYSHDSDVATMEQRYLYYRVYRDIGEVPCKKPVDSNDPFLSRMNVNFITPPHTANRIKRCLCFAEQISDHQNIQLFKDLSSESGLDDDMPISILTGDGPGFTLENPMALVQCPPWPLSSLSRQPERTYRLRAKYNRPFYPSDPEWLGHSIGDILKYDGIKRSREYYGTKYGVYLAEKASGQKGYVFSSWCERC